MYAAYDLFHVFQSGPACDNVCAKDFFFFLEGKEKS